MSDLLFDDGDDDKYDDGDYDDHKPDAPSLMERVEHGVVEVVDARVAHVAVVARSTNPFRPDAPVGHNDVDCNNDEL